MFRYSNFIGVFIAILVGGGLFSVKYRVNNLENELLEVYNEIDRSQQSIHLLKAEWTYLNNPKRLQNLSKKYLGLYPTDPTQLVALNKDGKLQRNEKKQDLRAVLASYRRD